MSKAMRFGYARVSTTDQDASGQVARLEAAGCERVFAENVSGASRRGRGELEKLMDMLRAGDVLVVTKLDRLGRSLADLATISDELKAKGAFLEALDQSIDTGSSSGRALFGMLSVFAEFERDVIRERQAEGIARAREAGVYQGGKRTIDRERVRRLLHCGLGPAQVAREVGCGRTSIYRIQEELGDG